MHDDRWGMENRGHPVRTLSNYDRKERNAKTNMYSIILAFPTVTVCNNFKTTNSLTEMWFFLALQKCEWIAFLV